MRSRAIQPVEVTKFNDHTASVYSWMVLRAERRGRLVPFTLMEFREWLLSTFFNYSTATAVACTYCHAWLHGGNFVTDHEEPVANGGSLGFNNLVLCCSGCNQIKGRMSGEAFRALLEFMQTLPARDANDMIGRMKNGSAYIRMQAQIKLKSVAGQMSLPVEY